MLQKFTVGRKFVLLLLCIYILVSAGAIIFQYRYITDYQYESMGVRAEDLAIMVANAVKMTDSQLNELEDMTFEEALTHPCNKALDELFQLGNGDDSIKYAYLIRKLPQDQVKYTVTEEDAAFYECKAGTKLDYIWLLDVIVNKSEQSKVDSTADYYKDKNRYTHPNQEIQRIYKSRKPSNFLWHDEWGTQISGLAPFYTEEGTYAGLVGVDIYSTSFFTYRNTVLGLLLIMLLIPTLILSAFYLYLHLRYRKEARVLAFIDQLTEIPNRRYFDNNAEKMLNTAKEKGMTLSIVLGDIDDFKHYNDTYGHPQGDVALKEVAKIFASMADNVGGFAARYGGEEFILMAPSAHMEDFCANLCKEVAGTKMRLQEGGESQVSISLGLHTCVPENTDTLKSLVQVADKALYAAKKAGKNTYVSSSPYVGR